jgi:glycerol-3-phosphate dehydrogenase (NAD(P)+)
MRLKFERIGIVGAGAWGTALAIACNQAGRSCLLWAAEPEVAGTINTTGENAAFLPGVPIPQSIRVSNALSDMADCDAILAVTPAQYTRQTLTTLSSHLQHGVPVVLCAKGIERSTLALMSEVLNQCAPGAIPAVLSGPSFAKEVAIGLPTAVTLACPDRAAGDDLIAAISSASFRLYYSDDLVGAEIGGSVKNVLAIACGIADGLGLGESARAALITRGFAEMTRLGEAMGARRETLTGLCGLGDLILTCSSQQSRNFSLGRALAQGQNSKEALSGKRSVAEGAETAPALLTLAERYNVDMPICQAVNGILQGTLTSKDAVAALLSRPVRAEI